MAGNAVVTAWLQVRNAARFAAQTNQAQAAIRGLGRAGNFASGALRGLGVAAAAGAVIGLTAAVKGGVQAGFAYNKVIDSQNVSFTTFLGSAEKAKDFMGELQALAAKSPVLDPKSTGDAARTLMAYGMAAKDIIPYVDAIGNMSAASGKSIEEAMPLAAMAIGQIGAKGKLSMEELNQLAEGVGLQQKALRKELGLTQAEWAKAFTPGNTISADVALPAILKTMQKQADGAADRLAKTTSGKLDRLKETYNKKMGELTRGVYDQVGNVAGRLATMGSGINTGKIGKAIGGVFTSVLEWGEKTVPKIVKFGGMIIDGFKPALPFFQNILLPLFKGVGAGILSSVVSAFKILWPVLKLVFQALGWLGEKAKPLKGVFQGIGFVIGWLAMSSLKVVTALGKMGFVFRFLLAPVRILGGLLRFAGMALTKIIGGAISVARFLWRISPPGRAVAAVFQFMRAHAGTAINWIVSKLGSFVKFFTSLPGKIASSAGKMWDGFRRGFAGAYNYIARGWNGLDLSIGPVKIPGLPDIPRVSIGTPNLPLLAKGGTVTGAGSFISGEAGYPERVDTDGRGRLRVTPLPAMSAATPSSATLDGQRRVVISKVYLNRRQIAEAVGDEVSDSVARGR